MISTTNVLFKTINGAPVDSPPERISPQLMNKSQHSLIHGQVTQSWSLYSATNNFWRPFNKSDTSCRPTQLALTHQTGSFPYRIIQSSNMIIY